MTTRACWISCYVVLLCGVAAADPHPLVELQFDPCVDVPRDEVRRLIAIELGDVVGDTSDPAQDRTRVGVVCADQLLQLRVDDPLTGKSLQRSIDLREAPNERSRLLALAIVELISASWTELETNPEPKVPAAGPPPSRASLHAALETVRKQPRLHEATLRPRTRVLALAGGIGFFSGPGMLGGGGVRVSRDITTDLAWMADVQFQHGNADISLGTVRFDTLSAAGAIAKPDWPIRGVHFGVGLRGGGVRMRGTPDPMQNARGRVGWAPWGGPMSVLGVTIVSAGHVTFDVGLESGYVMLPAGALVAGMRELGVEGAWLGAHGGICVVW